MDSSLISGSSAFHTLTPEKRTRLNAPLNAAAFFSKRWLERAMIIKRSTTTVLQDLLSLRDQEVGPNADYCSFIADLETATNVRDIA